MNNPCEQCIVKAMCRNDCCIELEKYIESISDSRWNFNAIGRLFRKGDLTLYADGRKNWWRMRLDGESMHSVHCQPDV